MNVSELKTMRRYGPPLRRPALSPGCTSCGAYSAADLVANRAAAQPHAPPRPPGNRSAAARDAPPAAASAERGAQLRDQILDVFHAHREADQPVADAERVTHAGGERGMRHDAGMLDEALNAA